MTAEGRRAGSHAVQPRWNHLAGSLIASGMVANAGIDPVVALYAKDRPRLR